MRYFLICISFLSIAAITPGCKKSPELDTDYLPVFIGEVEADVSIKTVTFRANFEKMKPGNASGCGFEWSRKSDGIINTVNVGGISSYSFSAEVSVVLNESSEYQVRAWIQTPGKKWFSQPVSFMGKVDPQPEIISLNKQYAIWGDTIRVKIRNLAPGIYPEDVQVNIGNLYLIPLQVDTTEITFIMPYSGLPIKLPVKISAGYQSFANASEIENAVPVITSISPQNIHYEDPISIKGKFHAEYFNRIIPSIHYGSAFDIVSYTNDEIIIKANKAQACYWKYEIDFIIKQSAESSVTNEISTGFSANRTGHWSMLGYASPANGSEAVVLEDEAYVMNMGSSYTGTAFYKYTPSSDYWLPLKEFPNPTNGSQNLVVCDGIIYSGFMHKLNQEDNFFRYDRQNNTWIACAIMPPQPTAVEFVSAAFQDKIYTFISGADKKGIYDPNTDAWTFSYCDVPDFISAARMFSVNGDYYFYKSEIGNTLYKYNVLTDAFLPVVIPQLDMVDDLFFTLDNKQYCAGNCMIYEMDLVNNHLIERPELANYLYPLYSESNRSFPFEINHKAYILAESHKMMNFTAN